MSAANRPIALKGILDHEGGFVNDPADPGGPTNLGITISTLSASRGTKATKRDVYELTKIEAAKIYGANYFDKVHFDELPSGLDYVVVDFGVNSGVGRANRSLQRCLAARGLYAGEIDGIVAAKTLAAIGSIKDVAGLIRDFSKMRLAYLKTLDGWGRYRRGWSQRVTDVQTLSLTLAGGKQVAEADVLFDPIPTVRGTAAQIATSATNGGRSAIATAVGVVGTTASSAATTVEPLSDTFQWAKYVFIALTVIAALWAAYEAQSAARRAEPDAPTAKSEADNDEEPPAEEPAANAVPEAGTPPAAATAKAA